MRKNEGLTLIEIILAIALLGIIAISFISVFASQLKNVVTGGEITEIAFEEQGALEEIIFDAKSKIQRNENTPDLPEWTVVSNVELFGESVTMHKLEYENQNLTERKVSVYLSEKLAQTEVNNEITVHNVSINVSNDENNVVADLTQTPILTATHDNNSGQSGFFANLYRWWRTQPGADPTTLNFPNDYVLVNVSQDATVLSNLLDNVGANSYVVLTVTPVDVNGKRGSSVMSSNMVYVRGEEWRVGSFPWVDMNNNYVYESTDHPLKVGSILALLDAQKPYPNPIEPSEMLDLTNGSLFVPMGIEPANSSEPGNQAIEVNGSDKVHWLIERNINLAKDITVLNGSDINLVSGLGMDGGTIYIHPFVKLDSDKKPVVIGGVPQLLNTGVTLQTSGQITLETSGRGSIQVYDKGEFIGANIRLLARGIIDITNSSFHADGKIELRNNTDIFIPGARKMNLKEVHFESSTIGATVDLHSSEEIFFKGGSWSAFQTLNIEDGKTILFERGSDRVNNLGMLNLRNTATVKFRSSMINDVSNQLRLRVTKFSDTSMELTTHNYHRNIAYNNRSNNIVFNTLQSWKDIGGANSNIEFSPTILSGHGALNDVKYSFDGSGLITIEQNTNREVGETRVKLDFRDKYSNREIKGMGLFTYAIDSSGQATIIVEEEVPLDTYTITFDSKGGSVVNPMIKEYGDPITPPTPPTRLGYTFDGWEPSLPPFMPNNNFNVEAKWVASSYVVTFHGQEGQPLERSLGINFGSSYANIFFEPLRRGYDFQGWYTSPGEQGIRVDANATHQITGDIHLYARWSAKEILMSFNANGGKESPPSKTVFFDTAYQNLPQVTRDHYNFMGWHLGNQKIEDGMKIDEDRDFVLTAVWEGKEIRVTYVSEGSNPVIRSLRYMGTYTNLEAPSNRSGYTFEGWFFEQGGGGGRISQNTTIARTEDHSIYAHWTRNSSCPFVYSYDGNHFHFEHEPVPYAINKAFESTSYGTLRELKDVGGKYHVRIAEYLDSETFVNGFNLYAVDYLHDNEHTEVAVDIFGKPHTITQRLQPTVFKDMFGNDWLSAMKNNGEMVTSSESLHEEDVHVMDYHVEFKLPDHLNGHAKLMVKTKVTEYFTIIGKWLDAIWDGPNNIWWVQELLGVESSNIVDAIDIMSLEVDVWTGQEWVNQGNIEGGFHLLEEFIVPIDLSIIPRGSEEVKIRLRSGAGFFEIDTVSIDFTKNEKMIVTKLEPLAMITNKKADVLQVVRDFSDDARVKLQKGDYIDMYYVVPNIPQNYKRGFFVEFKGHFTPGVESKSHEIVNIWDDETTMEEIIGTVIELQPESMGYLSVVEMLYELAEEISSQPLEYKIKRVIKDHMIPWMNSVTNPKSRSTLAQTPYVQIHRK